LEVREPADFVQALWAMNRDMLTTLNRKLILEFAAAHLIARGPTR
jgi:hypothetical protein